MEAVILAGGKGTRLREIVRDVPKPMAPVAGRPFLEILLASLAYKGFSRVVLSLGYMAEVIVSHFGKRFCGMELVYEIEEEPLGTGGGLRLSMKHCNADHVFVFNGDTFIDLEVDAVEEKWEKHHRPIIVARDVPDTTRYGRLDIRDGRITGFFEKGKAGPGLVNAGCYVLPTSLLGDFGHAQKFSFESDFLPNAVTSWHIELFVSKGYFIDIGVPEDYVRAQKELAVFEPLFC